MCLEFNLNARNKAILSIQFDTGARTTETIDILNGDLQDDRILIHGKGSKERYVPMSIELKKVIKRYEKIKMIYFSNKDIPNNYLLSRSGKPLTVEAIERIYVEAGNTAKVRKIIRCSPLWQAIILAIYYINCKYNNLWWRFCYVRFIIILIGNIKST